MREGEGEGEGEGERERGLVREIDALQAPPVMFSEVEDKGT